MRGHCRRRLLVEFDGMAGNDEWCLNSRIGTNPVFGDDAIEFVEQNLVGCRSFGIMLYVWSQDDLRRQRRLGSHADESQTQHQY